jgi:hypothetical protein
MNTWWTMTESATVAERQCLIHQVEEKEVSVLNAKNIVATHHYVNQHFIGQLSAILLNEVDTIRLLI